MNLRHALAAAALACVTAAGAAPITYTFTGTVATGEGGNVPQSLVLDIVGDTDNAQFFGAGFWLNETALSYSLTIGGTAYTFGNGQALYVFNEVPGGVVGFGFETQGDWMLLDTAGLDTYDLQSAVGPIGGVLTGGFQTGLALSGGALNTLTYDSLSNVQFSARTGGAVPEPASYALAGLALAGLALTRRRRT